MRGRIRAAANDAMRHPSRHFNASHTLCNRLWRIAQFEGPSTAVLICFLYGFEQSLNLAVRAESEGE